MKGLASAFHTLTILRFRHSKGSLSDSLYYFPIIGLFIGFILCSIYWIWHLMQLPQWSLGISLIILLTEIIITGALHIDGLSDWADSFGAFARERRLEIMKDPHVGTFGIIAISVDLLCRLIFVERLLELNRITFILLVPAISRTMMVEMCVGVGCARKDGTGAAFIRDAKNSHRIVALSLLGIMLFISGLDGVIISVMSLVFTFILKAYFKKRFGGVTGDLLGATNEMVTMLSLFVGAML